MPPTLGVIPHFDPYTNQVELRITGCLTADGGLALRPLIRRAFSITGVKSVLVNLDTARHVEPEGLRMLHRALHVPDPLEPRIRAEAVDVRVPSSFSTSM